MEKKSGKEPCAEGTRKLCGSLPGEVDPRKPLSERRQACNYLKAAQSAAAQIKGGFIVNHAAAFMRAPGEHKV